MRTRTFDKRSLFAVKWRLGDTTYNPNPAWSTATSSDGELATVVDEVNPRFQERSKRGEVINGPFTLYRTTTKSQRGPYLTYPQSATTSFFDLTNLDWPSTPNASLVATVRLKLGIPDDHSVVMTRVGTNAMAKVAQAKYPGLVSAGELGETLRYLRNPIATGLKLAAAIERKLSKRVLKGNKYQPGLLRRQLDLRSSKSIPEELSNLHLELMYGMRPLVREISDLAEALTSHNVTYPRETARSSEELSWQGSTTIASSQSGVNYTASFDYSRKVVVRAGCMYHFYSELEAANREWGVRLSDVPSALWALTPSSFVADWFLNTNKLIAALTPIHGLVKDAVWTSTLVEETLTRTCGSFKATSWPVTNSSGGTSQSSITIKWRNRTPTISVGFAPTRLTSGLVDLSLSQASSLMAMLTQRMVPLVRDLGESYAIKRGLK